MTARKTHDQYVKELNVRYGFGKIIPIDPYISLNTPINHKVTDLDEIWFKSPRNFLIDRKFIIDPRIKKHEEYVFDIQKKYGNTVTVIDTYKNSSTRILHRNKKGLDFYESPNRMLCGDVKSKVFGVDNIKKFSNEYFKNLVKTYSEGKLKCVEEYKGSSQKHKFKCVCGRICSYRLDSIKRHGISSCPVCSRSQQFSKTAIGWLRFLERKLKIKIRSGLSKNGEKSIRTVKGNVYKVDGYYSNRKIVFEFHGDAFHGNKELYDKFDRCHPYNDLPAVKLYNKTKRREKEIVESGYCLITIWENDWFNHRDSWLKNTLPKLRSILNV